LTLGPYPSIDLATARKRAQEAIGDVAGGKDPAAAKKAARAAAKVEREAETDNVERVVGLFVDRHAKPKTRDWRETERILTREVNGRWKGRRLSQITRAQVHDMLDEIIDRGAPIRANRVFAQFRKICRWAIGRGLIERNPCEGLAAPSPETKRERVLEDAEIRRAWDAFDSIGWPFGPIGKLLLLTGARRDEVAEMRWSEIDRVTKTWTLPASRTKNKRAHEIPLSDAAMALIDALPEIGERIDLVFSTTGRTAVSGFSRAKSAIDAAILEAVAKDARDCGTEIETVMAPERWTLHDLRRTVATNLQKLGVRLEVTEAVLNHVSGSRAGIVGVYQRHEFTAEKRQALDAWAQRLESLVSGETASNVVEIAAARR
jgi:integrase